MTLEEKISLVHGARDPRVLGQAGYWPGLPRLGIPPLRLADGPAGVSVNREATAMPAPVALAATFDSKAARLFGVVMAREAKALEQDILLAPHANIVRDPLFRRNHTTFSEDPLLSSILSAAEISGIQSQGILAQVKHLAGYNGSENVSIEERTLHEMYLPAFEAAVKAGVASIMCGYHRINGFWACENAEIQNGILRGQWGFQGFITSDWGAVHGPLAITRGVDLEMPGREIAGRPGGPYFIEELKAAVEDGRVPVSAIDQAVTRILVQMERFHLLGRKTPARPPAIDIQAHARIVRKIAEQGAVLLKNEGDALPLGADDLASLVLIGPTAGQLAAGFLGERAAGFEARLVGPLAALRRLVPAARIAYAVGDDLTGEPLPETALSHDGKPGLLPEPPAPGVERMGFHGAMTLPPGVEYSWAGTLTVASEGDYVFMVQPAGDEGAAGSGWVHVDGRPVVRLGGLAFQNTGVTGKKWSSLLPTTDGRDNSRGTVRLSGGAHRIEITASSTGTAPLRIRFAWMTPELRRTNIQAAVAAARAATTPVVFAWSGGGPTLAVPEGQDELIAAVAIANPRTIVVLNTGGPVAMPWKDRVRAILEMWYPGQEGGWATANLLLGRAGPGGKLPVTFPARLEDAPARSTNHPERLAPPRPASADPTAAESSPVSFSEGILVGYRWYDQENIPPLFPFGHGLSYTRFEYSSLEVVRAGDGGLDVSFLLRNIGKAASDEVPQVYLSAPREARQGAQFAVRALAAFDCIFLKAGEEKVVKLHVPRRSLEYWSTAAGCWLTAAGPRTVYVGVSSRDLRLQADTVIAE
jgi:beta-glucosidase